jgi:hypothetical protein
MHTGKPLALRNWFVVAASPVVLLAAVGCAPDDDAQLTTDTTVPTPATTLTIVDSGAPKLLPRDEANASFHAFRAEAIEALARKDTAWLYGILAPEIKNTFGGDDGIEGFKRVWRMDDPGTQVWSALSRILNMGGQQTSDSTFVAPYVFAFWPDSIDAFSYVAITDSAATVHAEPSPASPALGVASYSIVRVGEWKGRGESDVPGDTTWASVQLPAARGWVRGADVYSPVGWRAMFTRRGDRWLMILFVAGD